MTIHLVSHDRELARLCREILAEVPELGRTCILSEISPSEPMREADLHIWDFHPNNALPDHINRNPLRHFFLVDRKDLSLFQQNTGVGDGNVLLKPVTRATLATFLIPLLSTDTATSLRAERDEILQCLIQTNLKLQEYDQDRTAFLARAVHDFRAPLTALSGYCGLLLGEQLGPINENQKEVLRRMQNSANRLSRMASAMFALSVGRHVKRQPELEPGDVRECLDQALHEIVPFADEKSIRITSELEPAGEGLYFESGQIEQVLLNILDNACKFTPKEGSIEIRGYPFFWERRSRRALSSFAADRRLKVDHQPNSYRIDISDSGAAIPPEHLHLIFEEYTSYAGGRDRSGGGLGLAICKMIVSQHEGGIWVRNTDSGPVFSFVLPFRQFRHNFGEFENLAAKHQSFGVIAHADA